MSPSKELFCNSVHDCMCVGKPGLIPGIFWRHLPISTLVIMPFFFYSLINYTAYYLYIQHSNGIQNISCRWLSPHEKSGGNSQRQKVILLCLDIKDKSTGHESIFLASFSFFLGPFKRFWVCAKKCFFTI